MKTKLILAFFLVISAIGFSQKKALNAAKKALKSGNFETAGDALKSAEALLDQADNNMKAQYYFLKAQFISSGNSKKSLEKIEESALAYAKVLELENNSGKYSSEATSELGKLRNTLVEQAVEDQKIGKSVEAADKLYLAYRTNKADTSYLYYAASNAVNGKDYDKSLKYYSELVKLGYTGISESYTAYNKETKQVETFGSKQLRDFSVKAGTHIKPEVTKIESKKSEITKNIALIYISQGKDEEAIKAMEAAKKENPNDPALLQSEADIFYKLGNIDKYQELMKKIVANDPENPDLLYNLGVSASRLGDNEQALKYYEKVLELKSDPDNIEAVRTLMQIFYQLDDPKADDMKNKLKALEGGN